MAKLSVVLIKLDLDHPLPKQLLRYQFLDNVHSHQLNTYVPSHLKLQLLRRHIVNTLCVSYANLPSPAHEPLDQCRVEIGMNQSRAVTLNSHLYQQRLPVVLNSPLDQLLD